jgi:CPA1 family monovalent cation:H+ antiporter
MPIFETILGLLLGASLLSMLAQRINVPYPTLLAVGGALVAFLPGMPRLDLPPELILALFVAPVLLDAAHDASLRDLRENWAPILSLVMVAVGLTTVAVAVAARYFVPEMPWAAAVALGALLAPPDAVAALAVLRQVEPPHRIRNILEGESLLNDSSSLLIYKLAIGAVAAGSFSAAKAIPAFALVVVGSAVAGWVLAKLTGFLTVRMKDAPASIIVQFVTTFGVWLLAEHLGLSGVVTIVVFAITAARRSTEAMPPYVRIPSFATWGSITFVLNVMAFTLIGLHVLPIIGGLRGHDQMGQFGAALAILAVVVIVRLAWVLLYGFARRLAQRAGPGDDPVESRVQTLKSGLLVGWSGMRGIVTLAAALAIPRDFPQRDFILLTAFTVVLGTLLVQGLTLRPLLLLLRLPKDGKVAREIALARVATLKAAIAHLDNDPSDAARRLGHEYRAALEAVEKGRDPRHSRENVLRQELMPCTRQALDELRDSGRIGDEAYRAVEQELDWLELSSRPV